MAERNGHRRKPKRRPKRLQRDKKRVPKWTVELREIQEVVDQYESLDCEQVDKFTSLPLSQLTQNGLKSSGYSVPTKIQREAIPIALRGRDVLGAAKTGSGKTLAFLIPVLELLWRERWTPMDRLGALIISPTRELAYQTFEVLRKVGCRHDLSAGLVIGGKDIAMEKERIQHMNILICTPGRLLHHMDQTAQFDCSSLKILVLDEADRILDLGFQRTMNAIIENLPSERQTLLFSATQTKSVRDLARLSLSDPEYVAVHEHSKSSTPHQLTQSYITCELPDKLNVLYSFIRNHVSSKTIVFMSSCKQVKYTYEAFRRLRPGVPLMALYGRQKQIKRMAIFNDFCQKKSAVLLCTDIAARGLDIPAVDWVVQLDCPEDANTYIHRVGRTARYQKDGNALLILLTTEKEAMLDALRAKKIPIDEIRVNPKKMMSIRSKLETFCAQDPEMKHWAQRSFICYLRSIHLQSNKQVFDIHKLPTDEFARSLGLAQPPRIRFLQRVMKSRKLKSKEGVVEEGGESDGSVEDEEGGFHEEGEDDDEGDDILSVKRTIQPADLGKDLHHSKQKHTSATTQTKPTTSLSRVSVAKKMINKKIKLNSHIKFDEDGDPVSPVTDTKSYQSDENSDSDVSTEHDADIVPVPLETFERLAERDTRKKAVGGIDIKEAQKVLHVRDKMDRKRERERIKTAHREKRRKIAQKVQESDEGVVLASPEEEGDRSESSGDSEPQYEADSNADVADSSESGDVYHHHPGEIKQRKTKRKKRTKEQHTQLGRDADSPDLDDDEQLALHLLAS